MPRVTQPQHRGRGSEEVARTASSQVRRGPAFHRLPREGDVAVAPLFRLPREQKLAACRVILSGLRERGPGV